MTGPFRRTRSSASERGFTLIELLVVIIILGILAAVVVFAVSGVGDKGKSSAVAIDARTLQTAQEAFCAKEGRYADGAELVAQGFLSEAPEYHEVFARPGGGSCNGWSYSVLRTPEAGPYPPGQWTATADPIVHATDVVRLRDGRVLAYGRDISDALVAQIWDPATGAWTTVEPPPFQPAMRYSTALVLVDDPATPASECAGAVDNCGKVLIHLFAGPYPFTSGTHNWYLFDPEVPSGQWQFIPNPAPFTCHTCWASSSNMRLVPLRDDASMPGSSCGTLCGRVLLMGLDGGSPAPPIVADIYNPTDNTFSSVPYDPPCTSSSDCLTGKLDVAAPLADGRVLMVGWDPGTETAHARTFSPVTGTFSTATTPPHLINVDGIGVEVLPTGELLFGPSYGAPPGYSTLEMAVYTPDAAGGSWRTVPGCSSEQWVLCHVLGSLVDGRILAYKNADPNNTTDPDINSTDVFVYDPVTETWSEAADINDVQATGQGVLLDSAGGACGSHCGKFLSVGRFKSSLYTP